MLAPLKTATRLRPVTRVRATQARRPATDSAPAGSINDRVSSKTSLIAAQISSFETRITSSTDAWTIGKVRAPTSRTATPSAKMPT
jgi:hypothetical protein